MKYHVVISSNYETMQFYVDSEAKGLSETMAMLIALYERSESTRLMTISIFPRINKESEISGE